MQSQTLLRHLCLPLNHLNKTRNFSVSSSSIQIKPWSGLDSWRHNPLNEDRFWGSNGPQSLPSLQQPPSSNSMDLTDQLEKMSSATSLAELGCLVLNTSDPFSKSKLSHFAFSRWRNEKLALGACVPPPKPARPHKPQLVSAKEIPAPKDSGLPLNAYMLHNLAHVELNAIDLAWDTVVRFSPLSNVLGEGFFTDFAHVADDESRHFAWCSQRLSELGFKYGDMPAHNVLWRECEKSADNVAARLAAIPLVQEARGLDAGPRLVQKLIGFGDGRTSNIVARIADEEVAHVAVGVYWFASVCEKLGCAPCHTFKGLVSLITSDSGQSLVNILKKISLWHDCVENSELLREYNVEIKGPFNYSARDVAGIPREWYDITPTNKEEDGTGEQNTTQQLSVVYDRLASIISMECENANKTSR